MFTLGSCSCGNSNRFFWDSVKSSVPDTFLYGFKLSDGKSCLDPCICDNNKKCFNPISNDKFTIRFTPYCEDSICFMYAIIDDLAWLDEQNLTVDSPPRKIVPMNPRSGYLKAFVVSCRGCEVAYEAFNDNCNDLEVTENYTNFADYDYEAWHSKYPSHIAFTKYEYFYIGITTLFITLLFILVYLVVFWVFLSDVEFKSNYSYYLIVHLGIFEMISLVQWLIRSIQMLFYFQYDSYLNYYFISRMYTALHTSTFTSACLMFLVLAINRWTIFTKSYLFEFINEKRFYKLLVFLVYITFLAHLTLRMIPGYGHTRSDLRNLFLFYADNSQNSSKIIEILNPLDLIILIIAAILYIWVLVIIVVQKNFNKNFSMRSIDWPMMLQTVIPLAFRLIQKIITYYQWLTDAASNGKPILLVQIFLQIIAMGYSPFLYIVVNKSLRRKLKEKCLFFKQSNKTSVIPLRSHITVFDRRNIQNDLPRRSTISAAEQ